MNLIDGKTSAGSLLNLLSFKRSCFRTLCALTLVISFVIKFILLSMRVQHTVLDRKLVLRLEAEIFRDFIN